MRAHFIGKDMLDYIFQFLPLWLFSGFWTICPCWCISVWKFSLQFSCWGIAKFSLLLYYSSLYLRSVSIPLLKYSGFDILLDSPAVFAMAKGDKHFEGSWLNFCYRLTNWSKIQLGIYGLPFSILVLHVGLTSVWMPYLQVGGLLKMKLGWASIYNRPDTLDLTWDGRY